MRARDLSRSMGQGVGREFMERVPIKSEGASVLHVKKMKRRKWDVRAVPSDRPDKRA